MSDDERIQLDCEGCGMAMGYAESADPRVEAAVEHAEFTCPACAMFGDVENPLGVPFENAEPPEGDEIGDVFGAPFAADGESGIAETLDELDDLADDIQRLEEMTGMLRHDAPSGESDDGDADADGPVDTGALAADIEERARSQGAKGRKRTGRARQALRDRINRLLGSGR